jgi:CRISPR-associated endonuclease/helicase Cas3
VNLAQRFSAFFAAANDGIAPYPWQVELVERVAAAGAWPHIAAPTGAGKSSVIDVHVFLVAEHAAGALAIRPPRRLALVSPRRVLVDDQYERARRLAALLGAAPGDGPLARTATALGTLLTSETDEPNGSPLLVWRLRGGVRAETGWRVEPAACQIICTTPQMWGSRLLLRGYGASRSSRNLESGLMSHDTVAVIDEAHLHERLVDTATRVAGYSRGPALLQVAAMSATSLRRAGQLTLSDADLADPALAQRVDATKHVAQVAAADFGRPEVELVAAAQSAAGRGTVGVFVNEVATALSVAGALGGGDATVELVCGRLRPADLERLRQRRPRLLTPAGDPEVDFLVSTQSLEVGVDLDLPAMVSMLAPASALAQRAGRLNRSGRWEESTLTVVVPADPDAIARSGPYDGTQLKTGLEWLDGLGGSIAPRRVADAGLPETPRPPLPGLRRVDLETLAMTSDVLAAEPDPELYLQDPQDTFAEVGIAARHHLDLPDRVVAAMLRACPPRAHEIATMTINKDLERVLAVVRSDAWLVQNASGDLTCARLGDHTPGNGDVIVVASGAPICTSGVVGLRQAKGATGGLDDVLEASPPDAPRDHVIALPGQLVAEIVAADPALGTRAGRNALAEALLDAGASELATVMRRHRRLADLRVTWCDSEDATGLLVVSDMRRRAAQTPAIVPEGPITLHHHQAAVAARMDKILAALRLDSSELDGEPLRAAARWHDEGKQHPRFQQRMGANGTPLAKPRPGHRPDHGDGWRHEQLSAAFAAASTDGDPLTVTLVAAHHGKGRPLFDRDDAGLLDAWPQCPPDAEAWVTRLFGPAGTYELLRAQTEQTYGVHGLAWREALVRAADMQVSREGS